MKLNESFNYFNWLINSDLWFRDLESHGSKQTFYMLIIDLALRIHFQNIFFLSLDLAVTMRASFQKNSLTKIKKKLTDVKVAVCLVFILTIFLLNAFLLLAWWNIISFEEHLSLSKKNLLDGIALKFTCCKWHVLFVAEKRRLSLCVGCGAQIHDQYILRVAPDLEWHAACLKCAECHQFLDETCTCFVREGKTYCKRDYVRYVSVLSELINTNINPILNANSLKYMQTRCGSGFKRV